jgi:hypothetical protein
MILFCQVATISFYVTISIKYASENSVHDVIFSVFLDIDNFENNGRTRFKIVKLFIEKIALYSINGSRCVMFNVLI